MVIETLKAEINALTEATKEKGVPEKVSKTLKESAARLQKLLDKAREAAKEEGYEEEAGMAGEEEDAGGHVMPHKVEPGHKVTKTVTVKHDGPADGEEESGDEPDPKDKKDGDGEPDGDAEESRKVHIQVLLKEAEIPESLWSLSKLVKMSLKEAKDVIAEKKALIAEVKKATEGDMEFVPSGQGAGMTEADRGESLNGLFSGCAE